MVFLCAWSSDVCFSHLFLTSHSPLLMLAYTPSRAIVPSPLLSLSSPLPVARAEAVFFFLCPPPPLGLRPAQATAISLFLWPPVFGLVTPAPRPPLPGNHQGQLCPDRTPPAWLYAFFLCASCATSVSSPCASLPWAFTCPLCGSLCPGL